MVDDGADLTVTRPEDLDGDTGIVWKDGVPAGRGLPRAQGREEIEPGQTWCGADVRRARLSKKEAAVRLARIWDALASAVRAGTLDSQGGTTTGIGRRFWNGGD